MWLLLAVGLVLVPILGWASDMVCGNGPRPQCANTVGATRYLRSVDPPTITDPTCVEIPPKPPSVTEDQRTLIEAVTNSPTSHPNGRCHLTVVGGLAAEMSQGDKDAVNAAIQAVQDEQQAYDDAATNNDLCSATLDQLATAKGNLDAALQGDIDGITNIATAKTELADMMGRVTNALEKLMRCIRGRAGPPAQ